MRELSPIKSPHMHKVVYPSHKNMDLALLFYGQEKCLPGQNSLLHIREHYTLYIVLEGRGIFHTGGASYAVQRNRCILVYPDASVSWEADKKAPWTYAYFAFNGARVDEYLYSCGLSLADPAIRLSQKHAIRQILSEMLNVDGSLTGAGIRQQGLFFLLMAELITHADREQLPLVQNSETRYAKQAINIMELNYSEDIRIADIASELGLERSYFCRLFKRVTGMSPSAFLLNLRINRARTLLTNSDCTIEQIAKSVGYREPKVFSKIFKKINRLSPSSYRDDCNNFLLKR